MTLLIVITDNKYYFLQTAAANADTVISGNNNITDISPIIINDGQKPGTSRDYSELSAYNRLRHSERQRRRYKQMLQKQHQKQQKHRPDSEPFSNLRKHFNNNNNGVTRNKFKAYHRDLKPKRERNEPLCESNRNTVHMNTPTEEYDPPFFVEIRCKSISNYEKQQGLVPIRPQTCVQGMLRCVQIYKDQHFSRRRVGSHSWHPYTIPNVPSSCECMWPVDKYGHQEL
ncbi:unnamed protein product [Thelazia callipaeda]|uniref:Spaetzle domain-containing protein n=1 Tax=Thelazia callipaeda TaxID=103827 RepID=A0A0N5D533_THECL|nr:unnamed protein product [Thelazia callipaeda]